MKMLWTEGSAPVCLPSTCAQKRWKLAKTASGSASERRFVRRR